MLTIPAFFTPGPNNLMLMTSAAKFGVQRTFFHALGVVLGYPVMVAVLGLGLGELFIAFPMIKIVLKYVAALYFLWMAWHLLGLKIGGAQGSERPMRFYEAVLFQWINPKAWAMGVSFVSAFVVSGERHYMSIMLVTLGCLMVAPFSTGLWVVFGQELYAVLQRTGSEKYLGAILAILMVIAVVLFLI